MAKDYYPRELGSVVAKFRFLARDGLSTLTRDQRRAYGLAVHAAFVARNAKVKMSTPAKHPCPSGTAHSRGEDIHAAIRAQQSAALAAYPAKVRRRRTPDEWAKMYESAMAERWGQAWVELAHNRERIGL